MTEKSKPRGISRSVVCGLAFAAGLATSSSSLLAADPATAPATAPAATRPAQTPVVAANSIVKNDVAYGGDPLQKLDIYAPPKGPAAVPVLLFVHGGEWSRGDKQEVSSKPKFMNENGVIFVSTNYRLSPQDKHPAQVDDVAAAIAWVHGHIAEFGGDPNKIVIMGHSAGCHLVTLVTLNPEYLAKVGMKPSDLRGAVAWSGGMHDLVAQAKGTGLYPPFIKATFGESEDAQRKGSPLTYAKNAASGPRFLVASVDDEKSQSSRDASKELTDAMLAAGGKAQTEILVGKSHFTANHEIGAPGDKTGPMLLDFIHNVTR